MKFWLETGGDSYASLSMNWMPESKYHGLLAKGGQMVCSGVLERFNGEELTIDGYDGSAFWFHSDDVRGVKTVRVRSGKSTINYRLRGKGELEISPYLNSRSIYATSEGFPAEVMVSDKSVKIRTKAESGDEAIIHGGRFEREERWKRLEYPYDRERGEAWEDTVFIPGRFLIEVKGDGSPSFFISTGVEDDLGEGKQVRRGFATIWRNCNSFLLGNSIKAGYYWFGEWGRDSLISLPGLTLVRGDFRSGFSILERMADLEDGGLIPNFISDKPSYNSVDAPLWFIDRVFQLYKKTGNEGVLKRFCPTIRSIIAGYMEGTDFGIWEKRDLIHHNPQVTWMDAVVDGVPATPRSCAVEIQALWYNGLQTASDLLAILGEKRESEDLGEEAIRVKERFNLSFPTIDERGRKYLRDSLDCKDEVRPNQIFAISLDHPILDESMWDGVMKVVVGDLLTPYGPRSLSPRDDKFIARYEGDIRQRDLSYHNGPIWPWLIGPFIDAYLKTYGRDHFAAHILDRLAAEENRICYGYIPELYDAQPPYCPKGAVAQAWSMAEVLRGANLLGLV